MANYPWEKSYPPGVKWELDIPKKALHQIFEESCAQYGDKPFTDFLDKVMTFADYKTASDRAAAGFQKLGVGPGVNVGLYLPNTPYHPISFFGALRAGARVAHLSPLDAERDLIYKLQDSGARTLVTTNLFRLLPTALKLLAGGYVDRVMIGDDKDWGDVSGEPFSESQQIVSLGRLMERASAPAHWPEVTPDDIALLDRKSVV